MASDPVFSLFPEPSDQGVLECQQNGDVDRFMQKQYPMLYVKLNTDQQPGIVDVELCPQKQCRLCELDQNTADAIKVPNLTKSGRFWCRADKGLRPKRSTFIWVTP